MILHFKSMLRATKFLMKGDQSHQVINLSKDLFIQEICNL